MRATRQQLTRQQLIRLIHVGKRDLQVDDDSYRAILRQVAGKASAADLTIPELDRVLQHMKRCGFKVRHKTTPARSPRPALSRALAQDAQSTKIRALWLMLHELGAVKNPSEAALAAYVKRITKVEALQWIDGEQADQLIETLKKWAMRVLPEAVRARAQQLQDVSMSAAERAQLDALRARAFHRGTFDPMQAAWEQMNALLARTP